jgi:uncharacterized protein (DUF1501 family)
MTKQASRREFLRQAGRLGVLGAAAPMAMQLSAIGAASATATDPTYKALVCIYLYGGNDSHNTIVPADATVYARYAAARGPVAVPLDSLSATTITPTDGWPDDRAFALHPKLTGLKSVFDSGQLALAMGVGTLLKPTTRDDYFAGRNLPAKLMSHNDQFSTWQALAVEGAASGWGGRLGDLIASQNDSTNAMFTNMSVGAAATFSNGTVSNEFIIGPNGPVGLQDLAGLPGSAVQMTEGLLRTSPHLLRAELANRIDRALRGSAILEGGLAGVPSYPMPATSLGAQLGMVARLIAAQQNLGMQRQVFFVSMGGFDSHIGLNDDHPLLLGEVGEAMAAFQGVLNTMGMGNQVTTFTASDFGRSLTTNGQGSGHGWGSHHFVMGGAVKPKSWVGALPTLQLQGADDIGQGRLLPSISVDQYGSTLARWMGVTDPEQLRTIFPRIGEFATDDLGFMASDLPTSKLWQRA